MLNIVVNLTLTLLEYYFCLYFNLIFEFAQRNLSMKTEYQNILHNLDEAIIWQKGDTLQYYNVNSLKIFREVSVKMEGCNEQLTKLKSFFTQQHQNLQNLLEEEDVEQIGRFIFDTEFFQIYKPQGVGGSSNQGLESSQYSLRRILAEIPLTCHDAIFMYSHNADLTLDLQTFFKIKVKQF